MAGLKRWSSRRDQAIRINASSSPLDAEPRSPIALSAGLADPVLVAPPCCDGVVKEVGIVVVSG